MTAHVAEANEARGRVILRFGAWAPNDAAIRAAMLVANAYQSEVEILFIEDSQRVDFAGFPFAREFSLRDGSQRPVSARAIRAEMQGLFRKARRRIAAAADEYEVHAYEHSVRDEPIDALVSACARRGPWNMIAIAETFGAPSMVSLDDVFDAVSDATGIIVAGPHACLDVLPAKVKKDRSAKPPGPVVLAVEDSDHLQGMLRAGRYLAAAIETEIVVLLIASTDEAFAQMDGAVRLVITDHPNLRLARTSRTYGDQAAIAEVIRRLDGSFLIASFGGTTAPRRKSLRPLTGALRCPVLLVR